MEKHLNNAVYTGAQGRKSVYDLIIPEDYNGKVIIFLHGLMGYKDWGCWNLVERFFTENNYGFCKYNVSHNGGTVDQPIDFPDLTAFGNNTYSNELFDLQAILDLLDQSLDKQAEYYLIGHSKGGGIALLSALDPRVGKIATWAAISSVNKRFKFSDEELLHWKNTGVRYGKNGRTGQEMPYFYIQYEDFAANKDRFNIEHYCKASGKPTFLIHGDQDTSVSIREGERLAEWLQTTLHIISGANHTFGSSQPWKGATLPDQLHEVCELTLDFFNH